MLTEVRPLPENALFPIYFIVSGMTIDVRLLQSLQKKSDILTKLELGLDIVKFVRSVHPLSTCALNYRMLLGITTEVRPLPLNIP